MNFRRHTDDIVDAAEDLSTPASGGKFHLIVYGIIVPLVICYFASLAWIEKEAVWISSEGLAKERITGDAARAMAVAYLCSAAFMNFRWCWGLLGFEKTSNAGVAIALYVGIGAMLTALGFWLAGV